MKYALLALGVPAAALASATPENPCRTKGKPSLCRPLTWTAQPQTNRAELPTAAQCQQLCSVVSGDAGDWSANLTGATLSEKRGLVDGYPCHFSLGRGPGQRDTLEVSLDDQDILYIIDGAVTKFGSGGKVAATGTMTCQGENVTWWVD
ncbi:hypothetical protein LQW54_009219 [Pestalotiopsis sp. IQ-011]